MDLKKIKVGDRIKFRCVTRWGASPATRIVKAVHSGAHGLRGVEVRFGGWNGFFVREREIIGIVEGP